MVFIVDWESRIRDLLVKVSLSQLGYYPRDRLDVELTQFLRDTEEQLCRVLRRNGALCFRDYLVDYPEREAEMYCREDARNWRVLGTRGAELIAELIELSIEIHRLEQKSLSEKIMLFDRVVHAEHYAGAFRDEYTPEEVSIFGVDIPRVKREADRIVMQAIKTLTQKHRTHPIHNY